MLAKKKIQDGRQKSKMAATKYWKTQISAKPSIFLINIKNKICSACKITAMHQFWEINKKKWQSNGPLKICKNVKTLKIWGFFFQITSKQWRILYFTKSKNDTESKFTSLYDISTKNIDLLKKNTSFSNPIWPPLKIENHQ